MQAEQLTAQNPSNQSLSPLRTTVYGSKSSHQNFPASVIPHMTSLHAAAAKALDKAPKHSAEQWEAQKPNIKRLYIAERKSLAEVIGILARDFGFTARYVDGHAVSFRALI
jgi:hypothetical protein